MLVSIATALKCFPLFLKVQIHDEVCSFVFYTCNHVGLLL